MPPVTDDSRSAFDVRPVREHVRHQIACAQQPNRAFDVTPAGALPHFERCEDFAALYDAFLKRKE
jgi:hypothetical protein